MIEDKSKLDLIVNKHAECFYSLSSATKFNNVAMIKLEKLEECYSSTNARFDDLEREIKTLKESINTNFKKMEEAISEELTVGFSLMPQNVPLVNHSINIEKPKPNYLPSTFKWGDPIFYSFARHFFFLKSRDAGKFIAFLSTKYPSSELNVSVVKNFYCGLRTEWKKRISESEKEELDEETLLEYTNIVKFHWRESFPPLKLVGVKGGEVINLMDVQS